MLGCLLFGSRTGLTCLTGLTGPTCPIGLTGLTGPICPIGSSTTSRAVSAVSRAANSDVGRISLSSSFSSSFKIGVQGEDAFFCFSSSCDECEMSAR